MLAEEAARSLRDAGLEVHVHLTTAPGHATRICRALPAGSTAVAVGGDGTVHEVALGCLEGGHRLAVLPTGSGDDYAHALGLDRRTPEQAVAVLRGGRERRVDVGTVNGQPFVNAFGSGFDAEVAQRVRKAPAMLADLAKYLYGVVAAMTHFDLAHASVEMQTADGKTLQLQGKSLLVAVQNGCRTGGSFRFAPDALLDDGLFDVIVAGDFGRLGTLGILPRVIRGTHLSSPKVRWIRASSVRLHWSRPVASHAEGELLPSEAEYSVALQPAALRVLAP